MNSDNVVVNVFVKKSHEKKGDTDLLASSSVLETQTLKCVFLKQNLENQPFFLENFGHYFVLFISDQYIFIGKFCISKKSPIINVYYNERNSFMVL